MSGVDEATESIILGIVDTVAPQWLAGWAHDQARPSVRLAVRVYLGDELIGTVTADRERHDLAANGFGDGKHGFHFPLTAELYASVPDMRVVAVGAGDLEAPLPIRVPQDQAAQVMQQAEAKRSREAKQEATQQISRQLEEINARLAAQPDPALLVTAVREQEMLGERLAAMETWLSRLDGQIAILKAPPPAEPPRGPDTWEVVLYATLAATAVLAIGFSVLLGLR